MGGGGTSCPTSFATREAAIAEAKQIVDGFLEQYDCRTMTAGELWRMYAMFGADPCVRDADGALEFSGWNYAKQRCAELCRAGEPSQTVRHA